MSYMNYILVSFIITLLAIYASGCKTDGECLMGVCQNTTCSCFRYSVQDTNGLCSVGRVSHYVGILQFLALFGFGGIGNLALRYTVRGWVQFGFTLQGYVLLAFLFIPKRKVLVLIVTLFVINVTAFMYLVGTVWSITDGILILMGTTPDSNQLLTY